MSTSSPPIAPTFDEIKGYLNQIGQHLLESPTLLIPEKAPSPDLRYLERLNGLIRGARRQYLEHARVHYGTLRDSDLRSEAGQALLATLKANLDTRLRQLDLAHQIDGKPRKSFMTFDAGFIALTHEAKLGVQDRLLHPQEGAMLEKVSLYPTLRPGLYALRFSYQEQTVELAGAFVVTEKNHPVPSSLTAPQDVGQVLLFTPARGVESFDSLALLDRRLHQQFEHPASTEEFRALLPVRYQALGSSGIWPLTLSPISDKPLFEHVNQVLIDRRTLDIERALSLVDNPDQNAAQLIEAVEHAIEAALPDLTARLELRAQTLLERCLRYSAPDWYRSASEVARSTLAERLKGYDQARRAMLEVLNPATTPRTLARYQWLERLADELDIHDLEPQHLLVSTRRFVPNVGHYDHDRTLIELALRGLHTDDEKPGSDFLANTVLTYQDAPLPAAYQDLNVAWLAQQMATLQPRLDFADAQRDLHGRAEVRRAVEHMLDQRIVALAYIAHLQGHLLESDLQLLERLREGTDPQLSAATVGANTLSLHGAQLQDLWVLRRTNASGVVDRVLLCTPEAPRDQQFKAFDTERACQQHILGWTLDNGLKAAPGSMTDYLITRVPLRFRAAMQHVLSNLSLKYHAEEYKEVTFSTTASHAECLQAMSRHVLSARIDDYAFSTPNWYRSTTDEVRKQLVTAAEDAEGALQAYHEHPLSEANFHSFNTYLHDQARQRLNGLLGRPGNDVDPDTVWVYAPPTLVLASRPEPMTYTQLFRDGYADGVGFLDEKFSRSATFRGPEGIDLSALTAEKVARSVTGVWIGQRYTDKVRRELLNAESSAYGFRRNAILAITQRQLLSAAIEAQLKGDIAGVDLNWLKKSIASLGDTTVQTRKTYAIHRLMIDGDWVIDTYLFSHADNPVLLYTPQAPDGISFREARLFNYLLKTQPGWIGYLVNRVGVQSQVRVRSFLEEARRLLPAHLDSTSLSPARYDAIAGVPPVTDLRQLLYNMKLQRKIDNVTGTTVNRTQMVTGILWTCVEWVTAIATAPYPVLSLSTGMLLAFKDAMLALHAYHQGDTGATLEHLAGYLFNSAGAVFTDLRPVLRGLKPTGKPLRLAAAKNEHLRAMKLIRQLEPAPAVPANMQPVMFEGQALWASRTPDVIGRYLLYRLDPLSGKLVSTTRVAAPNAEGVWRRTGVAGGGPKYEALPETPQPFAQYEMPEKHWRDLTTVINPNVREELIRLGRERDVPAYTVLSSAADSVKHLQPVYVQKVERLIKDARNFFRFLDPIPTRAPAPSIEAGTTFRQLLDSDVFAGNKNLVIGAVPGSIASKQVLMQQMDALIEKGFKRLYVEYLPGDVFRPKLEKFNKGQSWRHIQQHMRSIDSAFGIADDAEFSYAALLGKAQEKKVKICALDATTSYQLEDSLTLLGNTPSTTPRGNDLRNFYSHKVIQADSVDAMDERWVALVEPSRMRSFNQTPGLADLHNAVALRIDDVGANQPVGLWLDTPGAIPGDGLAKADYRMTLHTDYIAPQPSIAERAPQPGHFSEFDIAPTFRDDIASLAEHPRGLDTRYAPSGARSREAFDAFVALRTQLKAKARAFFADYHATPRPELPRLGTDTTPEAFLKQVSDSAFSGLVIGEAHSAQASKAFLRKQMKTLKQQGFKTLYVEHLLTDLHQTQLDLFHRTQRLPDELKAYLKRQDSGHMPLYRGPNSYSEVIQAAGKYGIRVRALDCTASYHVKGLEGITDRNQLFSYFAAQVIKADQTAHGPHKWVAFVGSGHTNTQLGVPGLAELQGAISLHIRDVAPTLSRSLHRGYWETDIQGAYWIAVRSDFKLDVGIAGTQTPLPFPAADRSKLTRPGFFLVERPSAAETNILHRSRSGEIVSTPIQVDDNGLFFIDRWNMKEQRFEFQNTLIEALREEVKLTPAP